MLIRPMAVIIFVDRDPTLFRCVVEYLRSGDDPRTLSRLPEAHMHTAIRREFHYFNLEWKSEQFDAWHRTRRIAWDPPRAQCLASYRFDHTVGMCTDLTWQARRSGMYMAADNAAWSTAYSRQGWVSGRCTIGVQLITPCRGLILGFARTPTCADAPESVVHVDMHDTRIPQVYGTRMWLQLDLDTREVRFRVNDVDHGVVDTIELATLVAHRPLHPMMAGMKRGETVRLLSDVFQEP
jgi:hypothetical protein